MFSIIIRILLMWFIAHKIINWMNFNGDLSPILIGLAIIFIWALSSWSQHMKDIEAIKSRNTERWEDCERIEAYMKTRYDKE